MSFENDFRALTGFAPLDWQARLYRDHFLKANLPGAVDVPTGLGKTSVMALWLIARARGARLPRRLVYVVDRRAVVDQATAEAEKLRAALEGDSRPLKDGLQLGLRKLPISTLRGKFIDNREWLEDPASPAIVVGTVDMIGSRLLFEGYGVSRKMRPYHAGLLGADALVVLDEAHLVPPFQHLLRAIETQAPNWASPKARDIVPAFRLLPLSATQREETRSGAAFRLEQRDWEHDEIARKRLHAKKRLRFADLADSPDKQLAEQAWRLATEDGPKRVVVFCNRRDKKDDDSGPSAEGVIQAIKARANGDRKAKVVATEIDIQLLVGARRQREREHVAGWLIEKGFVGGKEPASRPTFLVATSAGEVGVDIDADHMVSDIAPWERMVQRLGRVNRKGNGAAEVVVFWAEVKPKKADEPSEAEKRALLALEAKAALEQLGENGDASPNALRGLAQDAAMRDRIARATTPEPLRPALSLPLVEAWSMTSLEQHTGRPEVAPWLRGWVEEQPQTTLVWRAHLPVRADHKEPTVFSNSKQERAEIEAFFEAAPPHESEKLETETFRVVEWLQKRAEALMQGGRGKAAVESEGEQEDSGVLVAEGAAPGSDDDDGAAVGAPLRANDIAAIALSPAGDFVRAYRLHEFDVDKKDKDRLTRALFGKTLVLDARVAGLRDGLLSDEAALPPCADGDAAWNGDLQLRVRSVRADDADAEDDNWRQAFAFVRRRDGEGEPAGLLLVEHFRDAARSEDARSVTRRAQKLDEHQRWAEARARDIAKRLGLSSEATEALALATRLHDEGKRADRWQRAFNARRHFKQFRGAPLAKTLGPINQAILDGYRHEFGSLFHVEKDGAFATLADGDWRDLALHLVAAHHGSARPAIATRGCKEAPPYALEERARDVALRFARLQQRWGPWGLAWWEALLRAADQQASRALEAPGGDARETR